MRPCRPSPPQDGQRAVVIGAAWHSDDEAFNAPQNAQRSAIGGLHADVEALQRELLHAAVVGEHLDNGQVVAVD